MLLIAILGFSKMSRYRSVGVYATDRTDGRTVLFLFNED